MIRRAYLHIRCVSLLIRLKLDAILTSQFTRPREVWVLILKGSRSSWSASERSWKDVSSKKDVLYRHHQMWNVYPSRPLKNLFLLSHFQPLASWVITYKAHSREWFRKKKIPDRKVKKKSEKTLHLSAKAFNFTDILR